MLDPPVVDLNGPGISGSDILVGLTSEDASVLLVDPDATITDRDSSNLAGGLITLTNMLDDFESIEVLTEGTSIQTTYNESTGELALFGNDTPANYQQVLRTLTYRNGGLSRTPGDRVIEFIISDVEGNVSSLVRSTVTFQSLDLVTLAQSLSDAGATFFGAAWCPACLEQKRLFEDGQDFLPFVEVTNPDRSLNAVGDANNIMTFPTWEFADGTRVEGVQSLANLASLAGISIPTSNIPSLAGIENTQLLVGSPLHVPLDGYNANGGALTYSITTDNPLVTGTVLTGNRSMRISVEGPNASYGDMVFELFEQRARRATDQLISLAEDEFYDGIIMHRIIDGFVLQGGDPLGTGTGGSDLPDFDDQFHVDLQHNTRGVLSMAKSNDDTNNSQFFITEDQATTRQLDFNHTVFGILVEGEKNREAISGVPTAADNKPITDVVMSTVEIFDDQENAVVMLRAADGASGMATVTVTVTNSEGNSFERSFTVDISQDTINGGPFLADIGQQQTSVNTPLDLQLVGIDVENDPVIFDARVLSGDASLNVNETTGQVTVTPGIDFAGTIDILVSVASLTGSGTGDPTDNQEVSIDVV